MGFHQYHIAFQLFIFTRYTIIVRSPLLNYLFLILISVTEMFHFTEITKLKHAHNSFFLFRLINVKVKHSH